MDVFEKLPQITKSSRGEYEVTDVISLLAKDKKVKIKKIKDSYVKVYPVDGYGNEQVLFQLMAMKLHMIQ